MMSFKVKNKMQTLWKENKTKLLQIHFLRFFLVSLSLITKTRDERQLLNAVLVYDKQSNILQTIILITKS